MQPDHAAAPAEGTERCRWSADVPTWECQHGTRRASAVNPSAGPHPNCMMARASSPPVGQAPEPECICLRNDTLARERCPVHGLQLPAAGQAPDAQEREIVFQAPADTKQLGEDRAFLRQHLDVTVDETGEEFCRAIDVLTRAFAEIDRLNQENAGLQAELAATYDEIPSAEQDKQDAIKLTVENARLRSQLEAARNVSKWANEEALQLIVQGHAGPENIGGRDSEIVRRDWYDRVIGLLQYVAARPAPEEDRHE